MFTVSACNVIVLIIFKHEPRKIWGFVYTRAFGVWCGQAEFMNNLPIGSSVSMRNRKIWPSDCRRVPEVVRPYWNVRDQVHEAEGLIMIFLGENLMVLPSQGIEP